jgi:hypothetical protein
MSTAAPITPTTTPTATTTPPAAAAPTTPPSILDPATPPAAAGTSAAPPAPVSTGATTPPAATGTWRDALPDDMKNEPALALFTDTTGLAKSYLNAQKMVGADKIPVPGKHATDEDWSNVFKKLGLPETVDKYEVKAPEGAQIPDEVLAKYKEAAHKAGILPKQFQALLELNHQMSEQQFSAMKEQRAAALDTEWKETNKEWGQAAERKLAAAKLAAKEFVDPDTQKWMKENGLDTHPKMVKLMAKIAENLREDKLVGEGGVTRMGGLTPSEATTRAMQLQSDPAYFDRNHPKHAQIVAEAKQLWEMAFPTQATG